MSDWHNLCLEKGDFDKSRFLGLLKNFTSRQELMEIFSHFDCGEELTSRAFNAIASGSLESSLHLLPNRKENSYKLLSLGGRWLVEQGKTLRSLGFGRLAVQCEQAAIQWVPRDCIYEALESEIPEHEIRDILSDAVLDSRVLNDKKTYALFEALYGIAADYELLWYIGKPLIGLNMNLDLYFDFWKAGGFCALGNGVFMVAAD